MSGRRPIAVAVGVLVACAVLMRPGGVLDPGFEERVPDGCAHSRTVWLVAQSVPTGSYVPCFVTDVSRRDADIAIDSEGSNLAVSDASGTRWAVRYGATCDTGGAAPVAADAPAGVTTLQSFETDPDPDPDPDQHLDRFYLFEGGCMRLTIDAPERVDLDVAITDAESAIQLIDRDEIAAAVEDASGGKLHLDP